MKIVLQDGIKDCGVCCLLSIIKHYGGNASKEYLRDLTNTTKNGVTAFSLVGAAKKLGFDSYALCGEIEKIDANNLPLIAHIVVNKNYKHFIVIYDIDFVNKKILIMDPAKGKSIISFSEFKLESTNNYIVLNPIKKITCMRQSNIIKDTIICYIKKEKKYIIFLTILTLLYFILNILTTFHFKYLLDFAINYEIDKNVFLISSIVFILYLFKEITSFLRSIILLKYSQIFDEVLTSKTYKQIILLPYLYYKNRTTGEVVSRLKDLSNVKGFLISLITTSTTDILSIIIFIIFLFNINAHLTYLVVIFFISLILLNLIFKPHIKKKTINYYNKEEKTNSYLIESLSSVDMIKGMHMEKRIIDKFIIIYRSYLSSLYRLLRLIENNSFIKKLFHNTFITLILYFGTIYVINKTISLSELIIYQSVLNFCISSFENVIELINEYSKYKVSLERINDILNVKEENFLGSSYYTAYNLSGVIKYNKLNYSYSSKKLFDNISFKINKKDKIFLYGPSGTGKSTFVKLLMRYIEVPFGVISISGIDINHYHLDVLRNNITYVSQQEFLFNDTIYNNIILDRKIDEKKLDKVINITHTNELGNISSVIEENGFNFSGGERQRIILARSILKNSDIYIFDEALSQIDIKLEREILLGIFNYLKDKTIIVISHRFENRDIFNRIVRLEDGSIHEEKL